MATISDIIEDFIMSQFEEDDEINISRNELANFFNCAPSQINYVLATRFNLNTGFDVESRRGGGGYVKVAKINGNKSNYLLNIINAINNENLSYINACKIIDSIYDRKIISLNESKMLKNVISDRALSVGVNIQSRLRSKILQNVLTGLLKED